MKKPSKEKYKEGNKLLLWMYFDGSICILVPKKRGTGFLRVPYGHHVDDGLEDVRCELDMVDLFGLDGYLRVDCNKWCDQDRDRVYAHKVMSAFGAHYGVNYKEIRADVFHEFIL